MIPNIFRYATKELSQDAVICWLVACASEAGGDLRECGLSFVEALMRSGGGRVIDARSGNEEDHCGEGRVTAIVRKPATQYGGIDVYFQAEVDGKVVSFVVEDKTYTEMHGGQLERYRGVVEEDELEEDLVKAVYFKTGYVFGDEREEAERAGYCVFDADDIAAFFRDGGWSAAQDFVRNFAEHVETLLDRREGGRTGQDGPVRASVVFRLTAGGGPEPVRELKRVAMVADEDDGGTSWIASRKRGVGFEPDTDSRLLAFARVSRTEVLALTARIVARHDRLPADALVRDMYEAYDGVFGAYWKIRDVRLRRTPAENLPGTTLRGKSIRLAFRSPLTFAYWNPATWPEVEATAARGTRVAEVAPASTTPPMARVAKPALPIHGVDFSGAREVDGRNGKIWIASWHPDNGVVLECGADAPGFGRAGLAQRVLKDGGVWVLDFPFGPPAPVAAAAGWTTWRDYLAWCAGCADATVLRDGLREVLGEAGVAWSTRRAVDCTVGATWFPFFEQLYRQTITGARDVLRVLTDAGTDKAQILPFESNTDTSRRGSVVVEGFPGWTLRRCGMAAVGYKQGHEAARAQRRSIVTHLHGWGLPISDDDARRAVEDVEGDAVDALVLLLAAHMTSRRKARDWQDAYREHGCMEGWFFD